MTCTTTPVTVQRRARAAALLAALVITVVGIAAPTATAAGDPSAVPSGDPRTEPTVRLIPDTLPADLPGGTIETPLGAARWVHLSGDQDVLPPLYWIAGPDGLVWFDAGRPADGSGGSRCGPIKPRLWTSADVTSTRTEHQLPVDEGWAFLTFDGDRYWLNGMASGELWRSSDLTSWERMDRSALLAPVPVELPWKVAFGWPVTSAGVTLIPVSHEVWDAGRALGFPGSRVNLEASGRGRYDVIEHHSRKDDPKLATLLVERTTTGIRLSDEAGATIAEFTGVGPEFVEAWASSGGISSFEELALVDGSRLTPVTRPGETATSLAFELLPLDRGFLAFELGEDSLVRTWRSVDGRSWVEGDPVPGPDGQPLRAQSLWGGTEDGRHQISVPPLRDDLDGTAPHGEWRSVDGKAWTANPDPPAGEYSYPPVRLPAGYVTWSDYGAWSVSTDGTTWEEVPALREVIPRTTLNENGSMGGGSIGNALLFAMTAECGERDLWIVEFDRAPAETPVVPSPPAEESEAPIAVASPPAEESEAPIAVLPVDWVALDDTSAFAVSILMDVAVAPDGEAVIVGFRKPRGLDGIREGRTWSTASGHDWRMRSLPGVIGDWPRRVIATKEGFAAIGERSGRATAEDGSRPVASLWTSSDGIDWSQVTFERTEFHDLDSVDDRVAILGTSQDVPTVWTSRSGGPWEAATITEQSGDFAPSQLAVSADGVYLVRDIDTGVIHRSEDGLRFRPVDLPDGLQAGDEGRPISALTRVADDFALVLGRVEGQDVDLTVGTWFSSDGRAWRRVEAAPGSTSGHAQLGVVHPAVVIGHLSFLQADGTWCAVSRPAVAGYFSYGEIDWNEDGQSVVVGWRERYEDPVIWHGTGVRCGR